MTTHKTFCRVCNAYCGIEADIEDNRVVAIRGDRRHAVSRGFTCIKGRQLPQMHNDPERLRQTMRRRGDTFSPISSEAAMDDVAQSISRIIEQHGPRAIALYSGTKGWTNVAMSISRSWLNGIGSPSYYSSTTIDQPARVMAWALQGTWKAGENPLTDCDVAVFIGANPLQSFTAVAGKLPPASAMAHLRECVRRGTRIIVIDPRRTETCRFANLHLQIKPGEDPTLLAGIIRYVLHERLYDQQFVSVNARGLPELRAAVEGFSLDYVERRTGIQAAQVIAAARLLATGPRISVVTGTGINMAPHPLSTEALANCISTLCGGWVREGAKVGHAGVLGTPYVPRAEANNPYKFWEGAAQPRIRGLRALNGELPTAALADEILEPGAGQVRALICLGGNPAVAFPDQIKTIRALKSLELLVVLDVHMSATAKLADYVFGCKLSLEKPEYTRTLEYFSSAAFAQYTPALIQPDFDVIEEWEFFWGLAHRMRVPLWLGRSTSSFTNAGDDSGYPIDIDKKPTTDVLMEIEARGGRVSLDEVKQYPSGRIFEQAQVQVQPRDPQTAGYFDLAPQLFLEDLERVLQEPITNGGGYSPDENFSHRLISRRMLEVYNSTGVHLAALSAKGPGNPAYLNPHDMKAAGIESGDMVEIESGHGKIVGVARAEEGILPGVVSMSHAWGDLPESERTPFRRAVGACTNRLIANDSNYEPLVGMCRQSAIPVNIRRLPPGANMPPVQQHRDGRTSR
jgi:anaerobic selenocysteine-containing dehydrogenase